MKFSEIPVRTWCHPRVGLPRPGELFSLDVKEQCHAEPCCVLVPAIRLAPVPAHEAWRGDQWTMRSGGVVMTAPQVLPLHRSIVVVDVEGSTTRNNAEQAGVRQAMYDLVEATLRASGI